MDVFRTQEFINKTHDLENKVNVLRDGIRELSLAPSINDQLMRALKTVLTQLTDYRQHAERSLKPKIRRR